MDGDVGIVVDTEGADEGLDLMFVEVLCKLANIGVIGNELRD